MKYEALTDQLGSLKTDHWRPTFVEIERVLGFSLPKSARHYPAWWANQQKGSHSHALSWLEAGWKTEDIDLGSERVTFCRSSSSVSQKLSSRIPKVLKIESKPVVTYDWDITNELNCELHLCWTHVGAVFLDGKARLTFPALPSTAGLYRLRIRHKNGKESRYVGESDNLHRRFFQNYRSPGKSQQTSIRINKALHDAIEAKAEIAVSIVTENAHISRDGRKVKADFSNKAVRRLFENFAQVMEGDIAIDSLNR